MTRKMVTSMDNDTVRLREFWGEQISFSNFQVFLIFCTHYQFLIHNFICLLGIPPEKLVMSQENGQYQVLN